MRELELNAALKDPATLIGRAAVFAERAHEGQKRKNGEPYFKHCLATARTLAQWNLDETTIAAGLLHDVVADTKRTTEDVAKEFGKDIAGLVDNIAKLDKVKFRGKTTQIESMRKFVLAISQDLRVVLIKLADRRHNMQTLKHLPLEKQQRIAKETLEIYAPLAYRLGMQGISGELQDLSFPYAYPEEYEWLQKNVSEKYHEREKYLKQVRPKVERALRENNIETVSIDFRAKRYASLYKKLLLHEMDIDQIYDLVAFRIVVKDITDCYAALGIIHKLWPPVPQRIKDYIAMPKPNGYQSIHTTVICDDKKIVEFQVRTEDMHDHAENGVAAHWAYKNRQSGIGGGKTGIDELALVKQLKSWQEEHTNPTSFIDPLKINFFDDRIFAITPAGEVVDLPNGATPIDFAYHIHSEVGDHCVGALINNKMMPLDHKLHSGDIVEIITQKNKKQPSKAWLNIAVTADARSHIKNVLKKTETSASASLLQDRQMSVEFLITARNAGEPIQKISTVITRARIDIMNLNATVSAQNGTEFNIIRVRCATGDKEKVLKLMLKFKTIPEVKEVSYRFV